MSAPGPDDTNAQYDVFISYRWVRPGLDWVRSELYPALIKAGLRPLLDVEDFVPGRDLTLEMTRANKAARTVLCVITPEYFADDRQVAFEALNARRADPSGRNSKLVPFILTQTEVPDYLSGLVSVDWTDARFHTREWAKLLRTLGAPNPGAPPPAALNASGDASSTPEPDGSQHEEAARPERAVTEWRPRLIFMRVNPRLFVPYGFYAAGLLMTSAAARWQPQLWQELPSFAAHPGAGTMSHVIPMLMQAMVCSVVGVVLYVTLVTGFLNMQLVFSLVRMLFLLGVFSFLCALISALGSSTMIPHLLLALLLVVAFTKQFVLGQLAYYWKQRSFGDVAAEAIVMLAFLALVADPVRAIF